MAKKRVKQHATKMELDKVRFGFAGGKICALIVFVLTIAALIWSGYCESWVGLIEEAYGFLGYQVSFLGAVLGAVYAFIDGFILFWLFALIYNHKCCRRK